RSPRDLYGPHRGNARRAALLDGVDPLEACMNQTLTVPRNLEASPYLLTLREELRAGAMKRLGRFGLGDFEVEVCQGRDSVWCLVRREGRRGGLALRTIHNQGADYACRKVAAGEGELL